jgi:hypothetical protein
LQLLAKHSVPRFMQALQLKVKLHLPKMALKMLK